jgi:SAM-dependent methyltransferase
MTGVEMDPRVRRRYESHDENDRLWKPGLGDLVRLRTWDILDRLLPAPPRAASPDGARPPDGARRVADVGGGPGTHAAHLAERGHDVILFDPVEHHVATARSRSAAQPHAPFRAEVGEARNLPLDDRSVDVVLLMGPLYHLVERTDRLAALAEAGRVLRAGGLLVAEIITRFAWVMDATVQGLLDRPGTWEDFDWIVRTGQSKDPAKLTEDSFWAYFHRPGELTAELTEAGFQNIDLRVVEGFGGLLSDLPERMAEPGDLLRAIRLTESEPSMIGASAHVLGIAHLP